MDQKSTRWLSRLQWPRTWITVPGIGQPLVGISYCNHGDGTRNESNCNDIMVEDCKKEQADQIEIEENVVTQQTPRWKVWIFLMQKDKSTINQLNLD
eukprot:4847659-Ditylum_brightwellii.AAC.2